MFGRYACSLSISKLVAAFQAEPPARTFTPTWNLSPGHEALVVRRGSELRTRRLDVRQWGWEDEQQRGGRLKYEIEAEEIDGSDLLLRSAQHRRCLVPADAFYFWSELPSGKKAFTSGRWGGRRMMALAGVWRLTNGSRGESTMTFAVITVPATGGLGALQKRMPVVLEEGDWPLWLGEIDGNFRPVLDRASDFGLHVWQVHRRVGHQDADGWELLNEVYEISPGDPLTCFRLASREIEGSRAHLELVQRRYMAGMTGAPTSQRNIAYEATARAAADCLEAVARICADLGGQKMPRDPFRYEDNPLDDCFGHRKEIVWLGDTLSRLVGVVDVWPHCKERDCPWPAPDTITTLCSECPVFEERWRKAAGFGSRASSLGLPREFAQELRFLGAVQLVSAAKALSEMAYITVTGLEAAAATAPEVGLSLAVPDSMPPGLMSPKPDQAGP